MRKTVLIFGVLAAAAVAGAAQAADYVVVKSTDPAIRPGIALNAGEKVDLASGQSLTLIAAGGDMTTLRGGPAGAMAPGRKTSAADAGKLDSLRVLFNPPPAGATFGGRRGGVCPAPDSLKTVDDLIAVQNAGCGSAAREALDAMAASADASVQAKN